MAETSIQPQLSRLSGVNRKTWLLEKTQRTLVELLYYLVMLALTVTFILPLVWMLTTSQRSGKN